MRRSPGGDWVLLSLWLYFYYVSPRYSTQTGSRRPSHSGFVDEFTGRRSVKGKCPAVNGVKMTVLYKTLLVALPAYSKGGRRAGLVTAMQGRE